MIGIIAIGSLIISCCVGFWLWSYMKHFDKEIATIKGDIVLLKNLIREKVEMNTITVNRASSAEFDIRTIFSKLDTLNAEIKKVERNATKKEATYEDADYQIERIWKYLREQHDDENVGKDEENA